MAIEFQSVANDSKGYVVVTQENKHTTIVPPETSSSNYMWSVPKKKGELIIAYPAGTSIVYELQGQIIFEWAGSDGSTGTLPVPASQGDYYELEICSDGDIKGVTFLAKKPAGP